MDIEDLLLSKAGKTTRELARHLIARPTGTTLPTVAELRRLLGTGSGTIQKSLQDLEAAIAIRVTSHGHRGSILHFKDVPRLWSIAALPAVTIAMPLPQSIEFAALATAIYAEFERLHIPFNLVFMHGARVRLHALEDDKVDAVTSSLLTGERYREQNSALRCNELPMSYYDKDSLVIISRVGVDIGHPAARVGIDRYSVDHAFLTERYFPERVLHDCAYTNLPAMIAAGKIDVAIWHTTTTHAYHTDLVVHIPEDRLTPEERAKLCTSVLLFHHNTNFAAAATGMDRDLLATTAASVKAHEVPVRY